MMRSRIAHLPGGRCACTLLVGLAAGCQAAPGLPPSDVALRVDGPDLIDADGQTVVLRAVNLGNWFLLEPWMYEQSAAAPDQKTFLGVLESRFGAAQAESLIAAHRDGWMTQRDFDAVAAAGFNCVRIPFSHVMVESAPFEIDRDGVRRLLDACAMAERAGLFVILDMHSVPGGQSLDQPSGDITANDLWTDAQAQERFVWLWQRLARELKNVRNFVAYDLINEPFGDFQTDITGELVSIAGRAIEAIRIVDPDRLIFVPATLGGFRFYGDPADRGWINVGFTDHAYPGVFDGRPATLGTHARFLQGELRDMAEYARSLGVPFLLGEFNPVFDRAGAPDVVRLTMDASEALGAHSAVWAHKRFTAGGGLTANNWSLVTNAFPTGIGDIRTASLATLTGVFGSLGFAPLATDQAYLDSLVAPQPPAVLPEIDALPLVAPAVDEWSGWSFVDVGGVARVGGQRVVGPSTSFAADELTLYATGADLFGRADSLRLASRTSPPSFTVSGVFDVFDGGRFAQAGVTVRASASPDAAHVSVVVFPDGRVLVKSRGVSGASTGQRYIGTTGFPVGLAIGRSGGTTAAHITDADGAWQSVAIPEAAALGTSPLCGFLVAANRSGPLSEVRITGPLLDVPGVLTAPPVLDGGVDLLTNGSFEVASGGGGEPSGWALFGAGMSREVGWTPVRDGTALLAYRHWEAQSDAESGAVQMLTGLTPGTAYTWTVYANRDAVAAGRTLADRVELRVETTESPARWLESVDYDVSEIAVGSGWSRLQVRFVATSGEHAVRLVAYPGVGHRDGALKFDGFMVSADGAPGKNGVRGD
jgi:endoglucanase